MPAAATVAGLDLCQVGLFIGSEGSKKQRGLRPIKACFPLGDFIPATRKQEFGNVIG